MTHHDDEEVAVRLGRALRSLRSQIGVSASEVARRIEQPSHYVSRWETGQRTPDLAVVNRIEDALEVTRGTVLKMAGFVSTADSKTLEVLASDPLLDEVTRPVVVSAYTAAVRASRNGRDGDANSPSRRRRRP